jgi:protein-L-isoaspartate O-methyltransferase
MTDARFVPGDHARRTSFDRQAERYDQARPSYPAALVDHVVDRCDPARMLEVGAGTGKATVRFARSGRALVAVEPGERLAEVLRRNVDLMTTYSDRALLPDAQRGPLVADLAAAIERRGGTIEIPYVALVWLAHRR